MVIYKHQQTMASLLNAPLRCFSSIDGDDFSGWFAIANPDSCNDFCFWSSNQTSDPHQSTIHAENNATWLCAYNAALDDRVWDTVLNESVPYNKENFEHLRCSRGPREIILSHTQQVTNSKGFWASLLISGICLMITEIGILIYLIRRRRKANTAISSTETTRTSPRYQRIDNSDSQQVNTSQPTIGAHPRKLFQKITTLCILSTMLATILFFS